MSQASNYLENIFMNYIFNDGAFSAPATYIALCEASISDTDTGSTITEASYTSYARQQLLAAAWNASSNGVVTNNGVITFPTSTGGSSAITHFAILDALTTGNLLMYGTLTLAKTIDSGDTPSIADTLLIITLA